MYIFIYDELVFHSNLHNLNIKETAKYPIQVKGWNIIFNAYNSKLDLSEINIIEEKNSIISGCCYVFDSENYEKIKKHYKNKKEIEVESTLDFGYYKYDKKIISFIHNGDLKEKSINKKQIKEIIKYKDLILSYKDRLDSLL